MKAPWQEFPEYERGCMGWRMGGGEGYMDEFKEYIKGLSVNDFNNYTKDHPEPKEWIGFTAWMRT